MQTNELVGVDVSPRPHILSSALEFARQDLQKVDALIIDRTHERVPLIPLITEHLIGSGGKRLRPVLTLLSAHWFNYSGESHIKLAASVECIHTATLLHDDVIDQSALRRGRATANAEWGNKPSVLVGDYLLSLSFQLMVETRSLEILKILSTAAANITEGEVHQLEVSHDAQLSMDDYIDVITAKTAVLFAAATEVGGELAGATKEQKAALREFGMKLGIAFQMVDDTLDYAAKEASLGKEIGDDFREGKVTLPVILAYSDATDEEKSFWERCMTAGNQQPEDLEKAIHILQTHNAISRSFIEASRFLDAAEATLSQLPEHPIRGYMHDILTFCRTRCS